MARMTGFVFQDEYLAKLRKLTNEELGKLVRAVAAYHLSGEEPELDGLGGLAFDFIRQDVDRIEEQYRTKCETNRRNRLGADRERPDSTAAGKKERPLTDVPKDKEKEKDKDKVHRNDDDHDPPHGGTRDLSPEGGDALTDKARAALNGLTDTHEAALRAYREELGDELVSYAIDRTVANGAKGWGYTETILKDYARQGFRTVGEAQAADERFKARRISARDRPRKTVLAQQYEQREYREEEMQEVLGVDEMFK